MKLKRILNKKEILIILLPFFLILNIEIFFGDLNIANQCFEDNKEVLKEPHMSKVLDETYFSSYLNYTLNMSEYEQSRDMETYDLTGNGRNELVVISAIWNSSENIKGLVQVFGFNYFYQMSLLDSLMLINASNDVQLYEINVFDIDEEGIPEIIVTGAIANQGWAFLKVYNFSDGILNLEFEKWWYSEYASRYNINTNDVLFADFDNDSKKEVLTVTNIPYDWDNHQNTFWFWNVGTNDLILENKFNFLTNYIELDYRFDDHLKATNIDSDDYIEILLFAAHNKEMNPQDDSTVLLALNYNGTDLMEKARLELRYSDYGPSDLGLNVGDFDADGELEILTKFEYREWHVTLIHHAHYNMINFSGSQFNLEFGATYWYGGPVERNQYPGDWLSNNFDKDEKKEFISTDYCSDNNTAFVRIWNYTGGLLENTETKQIITDCTAQPPFIRLLGNKKPLVVCYSKQDVTGYKLSINLYNMYPDPCPDIIINFPKDNQIFGSTSPVFDISILDLDLNTSWYTLDNGLTNKTFTTNGSIDQDLWDTLDSGIYTLIFYANDSSGNIGYNNVTIEKDITNPMIHINSPSNNFIFGEIAPVYDISIDETHLNKTWYTIDGGITNTTITDLTGKINQSLWSVLPNGYVTIRFYTSDIVGNVGFSQVIVIKDAPEKLLFIEIIDLSFTEIEFRIDLSIQNENGQRIDFVTIQVWWNGINVSGNVQNLGSGLYFISLDPITITPSEDPILLNMTISAEGYQDRYYELYLSVDPDTLKKVEPTEEYSFAIFVIIIASISGGIVISGIGIVLYRKKKRVKEVL